MNSEPPFCYNYRPYVGTWRSLVAHMLGVHGVGGSNPPVPTIFFPPGSEASAGGFHSDCAARPSGTAA